MESLLLCHNDNILAFTMGSRISPNTFDVHFEKARWDVEGAYTAINSEFAKYIRNKYPEVEFLNREEDMGLEGLRKAKESYFPHHLVEKATAEKTPVVLVTASGGARMQEGILSLMQMAKTSGALARHREKKLGYIVIMTNPTYGGVSASFATLGDVILSEPGAMVGFAGPRVVQETTRSVLPEGFQTAEFLLAHGLIDRVVERKNLRKELAFLLEIFKKKM